MSALFITPRIAVPQGEFEFSYVRSSGPGGQNVNKVNSKAVLRWNLAATPSVPPDLKQRLFARLGARLSGEGELVITSDRFRDQLRNREDCLEKLRELVAEAAFIPRARKKTRPTHSSVRKKKETKSRHSEKKRLRRYVP